MTPVRRLLRGTRNWHEFTFHLHVRFEGCAEEHAPDMPMNNSTATRHDKADRRGSYRERRRDSEGEKMRGLENSSEDSLGRLEGRR